MSWKLEIVCLRLDESNLTLFCTGFTKAAFIFAGQKAKVK